MDPFQFIEPFFLLSFCASLHIKENNLNNKKPHLKPTLCALDTSPFIHD